MALHQLRMGAGYSDYRVSGLLTTLTEDYNRISGHGVHNSVLDRQVACLGVDVHKTFISKRSSMHEYESVVQQALDEQKKRGVKAAATGDIFVEKRRMALFKQAGLLSCFPLMKKDPHEHFKMLLDLGFKAYVVCVDSTVLDSTFVGCELNLDFLNRLPPGVDLCGERGEYHTFVFDGPGFAEPVRCRVGEKVFREGFHFCDLQLDN